MSVTPADEPPSAATCPLCGAANGCVMAACASDGHACWCTSVVFDEAVIARVPARHRGVSCICAACARSRE